jgi:SAM-dependent methyltransferase
MTAERIEAILSEVRGHKILNVGCVGHVLPATRNEQNRWLHLQLKLRFPEADILGLDIDKQNVEHMRSLGMEVEVGDAQRLDYAEKFDSVILGELIEHLENPGACLMACKQVLKPGGRIIISTPNTYCVMQMLMYLKNFDKAFNPEHVVWFCAQTLRTMVERCGLRIELLRFVDDLGPEVVPDAAYRLFCYSWLATRWLFPKRYRNTLVAVCVPAEKQGARESIRPACNPQVISESEMDRSTKGPQSDREVALH